MARYQRGPARRTSSQGSRWMPLRFPGTCKVCGHSVPKGEVAFWDHITRQITCKRIPCADADGLVTFRAPTGPWEGPCDKRIPVLAEQRIGEPVAVVPRVHSIRLNSGAVLSVNARGRCEDAPCCGCCT